MLVERQHPEMNTFPNSFGDMTVSLDKVACLLDFPVTRKSVCLPEDFDPSFFVDLLLSSLGVSHSEARDELKT